ncbi:MAG: hypothetical protein COB76_03745, partial [Alphaproteobacteria bacterium]
MSFTSQKSFQFWIFIAIIACAFLWLFNGVLAPFIVGFAVAYLLNPVVEKLSGYKFPRWLSALVILFIFFITVIVGLLFVIPVLAREMIELAQLMPSAFETSHAWLTEKLESFDVDVPQSFSDLKSMDTAILTEKSGQALNIGKSPSCTTYGRSVCLREKASSW